MALTSASERRTSRRAAINDDPLKLNAQTVSTAGRWLAAILRIALGWVFVWAFLDKLLALGFSTGRDPESGLVDRLGPAAWINGGSPTEGFLAHGTSGPFAGGYQSIAGAAWADWLFMVGLAGIGLALLLGVALRPAAVAGAALLVLMWSAALPPANNPFLDDHLVYALALVLCAELRAGHTLGLGQWWARTSLVQRRTYLR